MEIMHPHLRLAAGLIMTAGLVSACSGGSSGTGMPPPPPAERPMTVTVEEPTGCTAESPTCTEIVTTTAEDGTMTMRRTVTTNVAGTNTDGTDPMTNVRTETVNGTTVTITVTSTNPAHMNRVMSVEMLTCTASEDCMRTSRTVTMYREDGSVMTRTVTMGGTVTATEYAADGTTVVRTTETAMDGTVTETTNMADATAMTNTETVTVSGTTRTITITVTSTNPAHNNRIVSVEVQTCTAVEDCVRTSRRDVVYAMDGTVTSDVTMRYDVNGRLVRTVTGTGEMASDTFRLMLSGSGGGRTETTVTAEGTKVQKFRQPEGGTAFETEFTAAGATATDSTVTKTVGSERTRTVTENGEVTTVTTGMPKSMSDTGFTGTITIVTNYPNDRALVAETRTKTASAAGAGTLTHRTYVRGREASGMMRETRRETLSVSPGADGADGADDSRTQSIATAYASSGAKTVTTTDYGDGGVAKTTVMVTAADGKETTTVYSGAPQMGATTDALAAITRTTTVKDGMTTTTTYGARYTPGAGDDAPKVGETFTVETSADGRTVTTTVTTGTGDAAMTRRTVKTDDLGVETERVVFTGATTRTTTSTDYTVTGTTVTGTTVTTLTETRASATATTWTESTTADHIVVMRDRMGRETSKVTTTGNKRMRTRVTTVYTETGTTKTTVIDTRTAAEAAADADWTAGSPAVETAGTEIHSDGTTTTRTESSGGDNDKVLDIRLVTRAKPAAGQTEGAITRDIVMHPGVQSHAIVEDDAKIVAGLGKATQAGTVMGQAILHLNYANDDAFGTLADSTVSGGQNVEVELITTSPTCAATGCTYQNLRHSGPGTNIETDNFPEIRIGGTKASGTSAGYRASLGDKDGTEWEANIGSRRSKVVMHRLLYDLLTVSGAGVKAEYTEPTANTAAEGGDANGYVALGLSEADTDATPPVRARTGPKVVVTNALPTPNERNTFTFLKETELPDDVLGIGQQEQTVASYTRDLLGGTRAITATSPADAVAEKEVKVKVENYFGWMKNSMFTVRRVTAQGVTGDDYDWVSGATGADAGDPDATGEVRAYFGMASGTPTGHIPRERAIGDATMTDPGTWTGSMIGVGSIRGERYRGKAQVEVDFVVNDVTTTFNEVRLAMDSAADRTANAGRLLQIAPALADLGGIAFESGVMKNDGSYTSDMLTGGTDNTGAGAVVDTNKISTLTARFYGENAAEVAGTFNAHGLALGYDTSGTPVTPTRDRGDLVGAFGAARDDLDPVAPAASGN